MSFADLMNQSVTVNAAASRDKYGKKSFAATGTTYTDCRIEIGDELIRDAVGKETPVMGRVYILGNASITIGDRLTLPGGKTPTVVRVDKVNDESGIHHTKIYLTSTSD